MTRANMPQDIRGRRAAPGFTLLEMLAALAIVGILAAIAVASYDSSASRSRRQTATACLGEVAAALERERAASYSYPGSLPVIACTGELARHYRFSGELSPESFRLSAEPLGRQASADDTCGCTLTLDETGRKGTASGAAGCAADARVAACW
ncbi:MAG: prepilin-type N-terminal cleavage/methylation domain-containing protein [Rhodocyclaceae bacterium]|nr:prepilin-type N-terminal cleavage/methylation domain-containing protein [Rhodocyclaceae bacterium]